MEKGYFISAKIVPKPTKFGLGVFVKPSASILCEEVIEVSPYSHCYAEPWVNVCESLRKIVFSYPQNTDNYVIGLGYTSLYNHSDTNNAYWTTNEYGIVIAATRNILENEQIFIHYGDAYWSGGWQKESL